MLNLNRRYVVLEVQKVYYYNLIGGGRVPCSSSPDGSVAALCPRGGEEVLQGGGQSRGGGLGGGDGGGFAGLAVRAAVGRDVVTPVARRTHGGDGRSG